MSILCAENSRTMCTEQSKIEGKTSYITLHRGQRINKNIFNNLQLHLIWKGNFYIDLKFDFYLYFLITHPQSQFFDGQISQNGFSARAIYDVN